MRQMKPMALDEIDRAAFRIELATTLPASPDAVFGELADPARWIDWFPLMRRAEWTSRAATSAVGAERSVTLRVFGRFEERILAWEPGKRFAFTITASDSPFTTSMAEDWRLTRDGSGTRLEWFVGATPTILGRIATPILRVTLSRMFRQGGSNLRRLLRQRGTQVA